MRYILILLGLFVTGTANAIDCQKLPDCASLGYSKDKDPNCLEDGYLNCPFDQDYKVCVQYNCKALGFTESDKTSWCADLIECRGNPQMTLCQNPCFATKYEELKELAESGKCKVVTMRNDITLPPNQGITLAANTIIDGGNHTLQSSGNQGFHVYNLNNNSGFKNILIKHEQSQTQEDLKAFVILHDTYKATLQDTQVMVQSDDAQNHFSSLFLYGTYEISGTFRVDIHAIKHWFLSSAVLTFKNADINITTTGASSDAFSGKTDFINSQGTITTSGGVGVAFERILTFENSNIHLNTPLDRIFWTSSGIKYGTIHLKDNAEVKLTFKELLFGSTTDADKLAHIKFESSATAPARLIVEGTGKLDSGDVTANNTANMVVLNGVTCHPKKATTTLLSEISTSADWTCAP